MLHAQAVWNPVRIGLRLLLARAARLSLTAQPVGGMVAERDHWDDAQISRFVARMERQAQIMRPTAQLTQFSRFGNRLMVELAIYSIAAYRAMRDEGISQKHASRALADLIWPLYRSFLRLFSLPFRLLHRDPEQRIQGTLRLLLRFPFSAPGKPGYAVKTWTEADRTYTHFTNCPPQSFVRNLIARDGGDGELEAFSRSWCLYDWPGADLIADDGNGFHYERKATLSRGDSMCDMCWIGKGKHRPHNRKPGQFDDEVRSKFDISTVR